ncbi:class II aldolase/adducin family protein [Streptomyces griseoluteus]|uniref:class II aldolase/adducin family protein n=1 Tax=Streptomyces griseoluteus TaxID=29306 RepID=UPI0036FE1C46
MDRSRPAGFTDDHPALVLRNHGLLAVGESAARAFLRTYYLEKACEIHVTAQSGGVPLVVPPAEVCEYTAQQLAGEAESDFEDLDAYDLAWSALLRMLDRTCPDCETGVGANRPYVLRW